MSSKPRPKAKKTFKPAGASLVQGLIAGADDVAGRSFLGGGQAAPQPEPSPPTSPVPAPTRASEDPQLPAQPPNSETATSSPSAPESGSDPASGPDRSTGSGGGVHTSPSSRSAAPSEARTPRKQAASPPASASPKVSAEEPGGVAAAPAAPRVRRRSGSGSAHAAVHESFADAKLRSRAWQAYGFRITPDVLADLKSRINADRRTTGNSQLAIGHYLDAALRSAPDDVDELIAMAQDFAGERIWDTDKTQPSSYRVGRQAFELVSTLNVTLQERDFGRRGTLVVSALVERYLQALQADGALQRPERRRRSN